MLPLVHLAMGTMPAMPWGSPLSCSAVSLVFSGGKGDCLGSLPQGEELCRSFGTSSSSALQDTLILLGHGCVPWGGKGHPTLPLPACCSGGGGVGSEEGRAGWGGPACPRGPGSFPLISSVTRHPAAGLLADNYLAPCEEGKRETVCPQGLESPPHPSTHLGKATKKKIYR